MHIDKIFIEQNDEIVFLFEKIKAKSADNLILIAPNGSIVMSSVVSLKILASLIAQIDKIVVLVVDNSLDRNIAQKAHLVAVDKLSMVNSQTWHKAESQKQILKEYFVQREKEFKAAKSHGDEHPHAQLVDNNDVQDAKIKLKTKNGITIAVGGDIRMMLPENNMPVAMPVMSSPESQDMDMTPLNQTPEGALEQEDIESGDEIVMEEEKDNDSQLPETRFLHNKGMLSQHAKSLFQDDDLEEEDEDEESGDIIEVKKRGRGKKLLLNGLVFILILALLLLGGAYIYLSQAKAVEISIKFAQSAVTAKQRIKLDTKIEAIDEDKDLIPAEKVVIKSDSSSDGQASGTKETGSPAQGVIDLRNKKEDAKINLSAGTIVTDLASGKNYKLVNNVTVPADEFLPDVPIEAVEIGKSYNQEVDDQLTFKVQGFNTDVLVGFGFRDISGGKKRNLTIVAQSDIDGIKTSLKQSLQTKLKNDLMANIGDDETLIENSIKYEEVNFSTTANAGDEVDTFTVNLEMQVSALKIKDTNLKELAAKVILKDTEAESEEQVIVKDYEIRDIKGEGDNINFRLIAEGNVLENLNFETIKSDIVNKDQGELDSYFSELNEVEEFRVKFKPAFLPEFMQSVPKDLTKIDLEAE